MKKVLTIAGTDPSGGAGIQADIKTMTVHNVYAMSVITSLVAQNTTGVYAVQDTEPDFVAKQLDCVFTDIFPDAVKIGMVSNAGIIDAVAEKLKEYSAKNIVLDPVMISTSGHKLLNNEASDALKNKLIPLADCITPNIPEAEALCGMKIKNKDDMLLAAGKISKLFSGSVLIKGGHLADSADDLLYENGKITWVTGEKIETKNTHGTGCTLSSAIACNLANELSIADSIRNAKEYVTRALSADLNLGKGNGPLNHCVKAKICYEVKNDV